MALKQFGRVSFCTCVCSFILVVFLSFELLFQFSSSSSWKHRTLTHTRVTQHWCILLYTSANHISISFFHSHFCSSSNNKGHGMLQRWSWYACYLNRFYLVEDEWANGMMSKKRWRKSLVLLFRCYCVCTCSQSHFYSSHFMFMFFCSFPCCSFYSILFDFISFYLVRFFSILIRG